MFIFFNRFHLEMERLYPLMDSVKVRIKFKELIYFILFHTELLETI